MRLHPRLPSFSKTDRVKREVALGINKKTAVRITNTCWPSLKKVTFNESYVDFLLISTCDLSRCPFSSPFSSMQG